MVTWQTQGIAEFNDGIDFIAMGTGIATRC